MNFPIKKKTILITAIVAVLSTNVTNAYADFFSGFKTPEQIQQEKQAELDSQKAEQQALAEQKAKQEDELIKQQQTKQAELNRQQAIIKQQQQALAEQQAKQAELDKQQALIEQQQRALAEQKAELERIKAQALQQPKFQPVQEVQPIVEQPVKHIQAVKDVEPKFTAKEKALFTQRSFLNDKASTQFKANKLTTPENDSVLNTIEDMKQKGYHKDAENWSYKSASKYKAWIESSVRKATKESDLNNAKSMVHKIALLVNDKKLINKMNQMIADKENSFNVTKKVFTANIEKPRDAEKVEQKEEQKEEPESEIDKFKNTVNNFWSNLTTGNVEVDKSSSDILDY